MAQMAPIDGMLNIGPKYRGYVVFPHSYGVPGARFTAGYAVLKPEGLNSFRGVLQGSVDGDFADKAAAILAALKAGEEAIDKNLDAPNQVR